jgi:hypothetical protein
MPANSFAFMKLRTPLTVLIVAGVTVGVIWLFNKPAPAADKTAQASSAAKAAPRTAPIHVAQVEAPVLPPVPASGGSPQMNTPDAAAISSNDPHTDLNAAIDDITTMLQTGNISGLIDNYAPPQVLAQMPPEAKAQMEAYMSDPQAQQQIQMMAQVFEGMKGTAPTMNDAGDRATYQITPPAAMAGTLPAGATLPPTIPITFMKVDGRWYISDGPGGGM